MPGLVRRHSCDPRLHHSVDHSVVDGMHSVIEPHPPQVRVWRAARRQLGDNALGVRMRANRSENPGHAGFGPEIAGLLPSGGSTVVRGIGRRPGVTTQFGMSGRSTWGQSTTCGHCPLMSGTKQCNSRGRPQIHPNYLWSKMAADRGDPVKRRRGRPSKRRPTGLGPWCALAFGEVDVRIRAPPTQLMR
jgi:hypothetical protein